MDNIKSGDRVCCAGNRIYGRVIAATKQWIILVNEDKEYLEDHPEDVGVEYAVEISRISDVIHNT